MALLFRSRCLVAVALLVSAALPTSARAQSGRNVLIVSNTRSADSRAIADYYAQKRSISSEQAVRIDVPVADDVPRAVYESQIEGPIAQWLTAHSAQDRILYIVLTKDVPLRIDGTGGPTGTVASVDSELTLLYRKFMGQQIRLAGTIDNPLFAGGKATASLAPVTRREHDIYLVTRLDGYTVADVTALIDRGLDPAKRGMLLLDGRSEFVQSVGNAWLLRASALVSKMSGWSDSVVLDTSNKVLRDGSDVIGYYSWGSNDWAMKDRHLGHTFVPGALAGEFVSTDARTLREPPADWTINMMPFRGSHQSLIGDLIRDGVTGVAGHVAEPYLNATIRPDVLFPAYFSGLNLAESFYRAMPFLSWQTVVIGDPLCAPFRTRPVDVADLDAGMDPVTELPSFLSQRRVAELTAIGAKREAAQAIAKAEVHERRGDIDGALASLQDAVTIQPTLVSAQMKLALLSELTGSWDTAIASYRQVIGMNPNDGPALNNLAYTLAVRKRDPGAALPLAKRAYALQNASPEATDTLAWTQHLLGNDIEALPLIRTAVSKLPQSVDVHLHAAVILAATGNIAAGRSELELAKKLDPRISQDSAIEQLSDLLGASK